VHKVKLEESRENKKRVWHAKEGLRAKKGVDSGLWEGRRTWKKGNYRRRGLKKGGAVGQVRSDQPRRAIKG